MGTQSERDLTKVTKVRVRTNAKDMINNGPSSSMMNSSPQGASFKPRTKMKTTTMIITKDDTVTHSISAPSMTSKNIDVVRDPLNWQLVDQTMMQLQKASDDLVQLYKRISL